MDKGDIPDKIKECLIIALGFTTVIIIFVFIVFAILNAFGLLTCAQVKTPEHRYNSSFDSGYIIQGNSIKASGNVVHGQPRVLGIMTSNDLDYDTAVLLNRIAECESGWNNVCNSRYGCRAGQGIFQLIPSTVRSCEIALEKTIDPFNNEDSLECAVWLLLETSQSHNHWGYPDWHSNAYHNGIRWGSYNCFKDYIIVN